jgi:hypothetical protein
MASKKSDLLQKGLEDLHPFAARMASSQNETLETRNQGSWQASKESSLDDSESHNSFKQTNEDSPELFDRPYARTINVRHITRYAFEFFQDQISSLKQLSLDEKQNGEKGSMSQMVREALDDYLTKRKSQR